MFSMHMFFFHLQLHISYFTNFPFFTPVYMHCCMYSIFSISILLFHDFPRQVQVILYLYNSIYVNYLLESIHHVDFLCLHCFFLCTHCSIGLVINFVLISGYVKCLFESINHVDFLCLHGIFIHIALQV